MPSGRRRSRGRRRERGRRRVCSSFVFPPSFYSTRDGNPLTPTEKKKRGAGDHVGEDDENRRPVPDDHPARPLEEAFLVGEDALAVEVAGDVGRQVLGTGVPLQRIE